MSSEKTSNPNYRLHKKLMRRRAVRESWPLLVWLGMAALAVWAYRTGADFERMRGVVSKPIEIVGAPITGKLVPLDDLDLPIPRDEKGRPKKLEQGTFVNKDDVVAKIDDTLLNLKMAAEEQTAHFERAKLQVELGQQVQEFQDRVFQLENEKQRIEEELAPYPVLIEQTALEVERGGKLQSELEEVQTEYNALKSDLAAVNRNIEGTKKLVATAIQRIDDLQNKVDLAPGESATIQLLKEQVKQAVVRATHSGFIDKIYAQPGSVVREGDPIMEIVIQEPKTITALIPEANALTLKRGDEVYIAIPNNRKEFVTATVVTLQQSLTQLPDYGSPIRGRMVRGRMVEFGNLEQNAPDSQLPLLPGSEVIITLEPPGRIPFLSWFTE